MVYDEPVFKTLGDTAINVEFGDESSIPINFRILALDFALREHPPTGLVETNPQVRTLGLVFDPLTTTRAHIVDHVKALIAAQGTVATLPSRRVIIPALYDDPWSRECAEAFGVRNNIEYIAEFNGMTVAQVIETHTGCDYWVTGVGFVPGAFMSYAMDPGKRFGAPLYRTPRTWTHARLLNFGGAHLDHLSDPRAGRRPALRPHADRNLRPEGAQPGLRRRPGARPRRRPAPL